MKIFPSKKYILKTNMPIGEVLERLRKDLKPRRWIRLKYYLNDEKNNYEGKIFGNTFKFNRIEFNRTSLMPVVSGTIKMKDEHSHILVVIQYGKLQIVTVYTYIGIFALSFLAGLIIQLANLEFIPVLFAPLIFLIIGPLMFFFFRPDLNEEAKDAIEYLENIFETKATEPLKYQS
jgi:hypothetical protein